MTTINLSGIHSVLHFQHPYFTSFINFKKQFQDLKPLQIENKVK